MATSRLGVRRLHSIELSVRDAEPWLAYLIDGFGFQRLAVSAESAVEADGTRYHMLRCREERILVRERVRPGSSVAGFLDRHAEGVSALNFRVESAADVEEQLVERGAAPTEFLRSETVAGGAWRQVAIATPLGDVEFGFIECDDAAADGWPGLEPCGTYDSARNPIGLLGIDHLVANMRTVMPAIAFYEHVLGFTRRWDVRFHVEDIQPGVGGGLKSIVMGDDTAGLRIMNNEPLRPRFAESQVQATIDDNGGPGIQHIALAVEDVMSACIHLHGSGVQFMPVPSSYYDRLPKRMESLKIESIGATPDDLRRFGILFDGDANGYLLQVICRDQATQFKRRDAGPVFIELIQRCGCRGFGEGNSRALFEAAQQA